MERILLFVAVWIACCGYAVLRGGVPERLGAGLLSLAFVASALVQSEAPDRFTTIDVGLVIVDLALVICLLALSLASTRFWPLWLCAMQLIVLLAHGAIALNPEVVSWAYWRAVSLWSYPQLVILAVATYGHQMRRQRNAVYPSWKTSYAHWLDLVRARWLNS